MIWLFANLLPLRQGAWQRWPYKLPGRRRVCAKNLASQAIFLQTRSVGYHPNTRQHYFVTRSCEYRSGQRRIIDQSEKLFQKGLDTLERLFTN